MGKKYSQAFTLIELVIVVSIIVFLALIAITYLRTQAFKGNDARRKADIKKIQIAVEEYEKDHDCYPLPSLVTCNPGTSLTPYISKIPCDPVTNASYYYDYEDSSCPSWYRIFTELDNDKDEDALLGVGPFSSYNYYQGSPNSPSPSESGSTPPPGGGGEQSGFYGCVGGVCVPISWDPTRPGPACDPNFQSPDCYNQCGPQMLECTPWH